MPNPAPETLDSHAGQRHLLSFDVEEYFQVEAAARAGVRPEDWGRFPPRLAIGVDRVLSLLSDFGATATFFVLGWVAGNQPDVVKAIARAGHEIASHGMNHRMIDGMTESEFKADVTESRKALEDLSGREVVGYRAPTFSIMHRTAWAIDVLAEAGFSYDSSVYPVRHDRYGVPDAPAEPHTAQGPAGGRILEIPPLTRRALGLKLPVGGGGFLRLLPVRWVGNSLNRARQAGRPGMIYAHPWELDPDQPVLPMGRLSRFRHRVNLSRTADKLRWLLERFAFTDVRSQLDHLRALASARMFVYGSK